ncbi:MAG: dipeptide ABC transporter ATP-binding protein [Ahrensia sp.]|nr:dipeptide ABC transporter ATP-binding protein [Ahrensia sp.]
MREPILTIDNLSVMAGDHRILHSINISLSAGEIHAIVGESGSGKSITALSVMGLLPPALRAHGSINFAGNNLVEASEADMCALRGDDIAMVFQEPMTALNPVKTIGEQIAEGIRWHTKVSRAAAEDRTRAILDRVGLPAAKFPLTRFPHELSGGQRQRVVIAIACALNPKLLIADEPTTALDVVLQAQILDLLRELVAENNMGLILISHDLGVVAEMADTLTILRGGVVQDQGDAIEVLRHQRHSYTRQLAEASTHTPAWQARGAQASDIPLLKVEGVSKVYSGRRSGLFSPAKPFIAVDNVSFEIPAGRSVGLVGQSGCGKSTLARIVLALDQATSGTVEFAGTKMSDATAKALRAARRDMHVVFQDPYGSFNPRMTVEKLIAEPLFLLPEKLSRSDTRDRVASALQEVSMDVDAMDKYPHEFSGGQRQRLAIARAIITRPKLVVADEPVSALDVSIRAQILDLFAKLNDELGLAFLFITHDLAVARAITHEVMVMSHGKIVERGLTHDILDSPQTDAAQKLVKATPNLIEAIARRSKIEKGE